MFRGGFSPVDSKPHGQHRDLPPPPSFDLGLKPLSQLCGRTPTPSRSCLPESALTNPFLAQRPSTKARPYERSRCSETAASSPPTPKHLGPPPWRLDPAQPQRRRLNREAPLLGEAFSSDKVPSDGRRQLEPAVVGQERVAARGDVDRVWPRISRMSIGGWRMDDSLTGGAKVAGESIKAVQSQSA